MTDRPLATTLTVVLLVVDHLHVSILLDPQLAHNDIVDAADGVRPRIRFIVPADTERHLQSRRHFHRPLNFRAFFFSGGGGCKGMLYSQVT